MEQLNKKASLVPRPDYREVYLTLRDLIPDLMLSEAGKGDQDLIRALYHSRGDEQSLAIGVAYSIKRMYEAIPEPDKVGVDVPLIEYKDFVKRVVDGLLLFDERLFKRPITRLFGDDITFGWDINPKSRHIPKLRFLGKRFVAESMNTIPYFYDEAYCKSFLCQIPLSTRKVPSDYKRLVLLPTRTEGFNWRMHYRVGKYWTSEGHVFANKKSEMDALCAQDHNAFLKEKLDELQSIRAGVNHPEIEKHKRSGPIYRKDAPTESEFLEEFNLKAIQLGDWAKRKDADMFALQLYHGLCDLSEAIGLPKEYIGLSKTLTLQVVPRAQKGDQVYYERGVKCLVLAKRQNKGQFAHAWANALDEYIGHRSFRRKTSTGSESYYLKDLPDDEYGLIKKMRNLYRLTEFSRSPMYVLSALTLDGVCNFKKLHHAMNGELFARAFYQYVNTKTDNTFLSSMRGPDDIFEKMLFPENKEKQGFITAFDEVFESIRKVIKIRR